MKMKHKMTPAACLNVEDVINEDDSVSVVRDFDRK